MKGSNYAYSKKISEDRIEKYYKNFVRRQELMSKGRYRELWLRKILLEGYKISWRYIKWFFNRVLRLKKITGRDKHVKRIDLIKFR